MMSTEQRSLGDEGDQVLESALRAVMAEPPPSDVRQRVIDTAASWNQRSAAHRPQQDWRSAIPAASVLGSSGTRSRAADRIASRLNRLPVWMVAGATIVAVMVFSLRLLRPTQSWAQVSEAVQTRPWILAKFTTPDGVHHEAWTSLSRGVTADRQKDSIRFSDHGLKVSYAYDPKERTLTRRPDSKTGGIRKESDRGVLGLMQQIFRGAETLDITASGVQIVEQKRQTVAKHGRTWQSYELSLRFTDAYSDGQTLVEKLTFLVDPQTRLPHLLLIDAPSGQPPSVEFSYPETGPTDIYDLGVPRDAKLVDLVPTDDVRHLISEMKSSAGRFEDYLAFTVVTDAGSPWYVGTPLVLWRKGTCCRNVFGVVDSAAAPLTAPEPNADEFEWWKRRWAELFHRPLEVCDGKTLWTNDTYPEGWFDEPKKPHPLTWKCAAFPPPKWKSEPRRSSWPANLPPLLVAYPQRLLSVGGFQSQPLLEFRPVDGPADTIKITFRRGSPNTTTSVVDRYWIDPNRSHMVVRNESVGFDFRFSTDVEKADRSPCGIWFPTLVRHTTIIKQGDETKTVDGVTRHYLDFNVKFSEELFRPVERPGEPLE